MTNDKEKPIEETLALFGVDKLKPEQKIMLDCLLDGKDCIAILPTGFGKSLPYQMLPLVKQQMSSTTPTVDVVVEENIVVCCPIISLMEDQVTKLKKIPGYSVVFKGSNPEDDELIKTGKTAVIYASPETLVGDKEWRSYLHSKTIKTIVVDEFHTLSIWEGLEEEETAFRKWFKHVGELRSMFPSASLLALSATCPKNIKKKVLKALNMDSSTVFISVSTNKPNLKLCVQKIENSIEFSMLWLIETLTRLQISYLYELDKATVRFIYKYLISESENCTELIEMYHSETPDKQKKAIISKLQGPNSSLRLIIATSALGMGIDIASCNNVILYGPPKSFIKVIQEVGRIGRDGTEYIALLKFNSYHLRNCDDSLKQLYTGKSCRRLKLMEQFVTKAELNTIMTGTHICCDVCEALCSCGNCERLSLQTYLTIPESESTETSSSDTVQHYRVRTLIIKFN